MKTIKNIFKFILTLVIWPFIPFRIIKSNLINNFSTVYEPEDSMDRIPSGKKANLAIFSSFLILPILILELVLFSFLPDIKEPLAIAIVFIFFILIFRYAYLNQAFKKYNKKRE